MVHLARRLRLTAILSLAFVLSLLLNACYFDEATLQNTQSFNASDINAVKIDYGTENVTLFKTDSENITVKEYISQSDPIYYASMEVSDGTLQIKRGQRFNNAVFSSYVEVYLPHEYTGSVDISTSTGIVSSSASLQAAEFTVRTGSGNIALGGISADKVSLLTTSGRIAVSRVSGTLVCTSATSAVKITDLRGQAKITSDSGKIDLSCGFLTGNVSCTTDSGKLSVSMPQTTSFKLQARSKSGNVNCGFMDELTDGSSSQSLSAETASGSSSSSEQDGSSSDAVDLSGAFGQPPRYCIDLVTGSGTMEISYTK